MRARAKTAAWVSIVLGIGVLAACLLRWKDLAVQYHLHRLRSDPAYLRVILPPEEGTAVHAALERHIGSLAGKERFLEIYFEILSVILDKASFPIGDRAATHGLVIIPANEIFCVFWVKGEIDETHWAKLENAWVPMMSSVRTHMSALNGKTLTTKLHPGRVFTFLPWDEAALRTGVYGGLRNGHPGRYEIVTRGPRPPDWITKADLELMKNTIVVLMETPPTIPAGAEGR